MPNDFCGFGALEEAFHAMEARNFGRIFVVASRTGWERFNAKGKRPFFSGRQVELFTDFSNNPDFREIQKGMAAFGEFNPDVIIAVGGGSSIDVAKVIKAGYFTREPYDAARPESIKPSGDGPPLVAISTTAGSGSEATQYAVFYIGETKQSIAHPSIRPEMAVADPEMTYTLPPGQTAATGFDAISQSVEAYWSSFTTPEAQELAAASIQYGVNNIYNAVHSPAPGNRYNMSQSAYLSGKAINFTRTTIPHALAYHLTKRHRLPHGHAVALTLPYFFLINLDPECEVITPLGPEKHRENMEGLFRLLGQRNGEDAFAFWRNLMRHCGLASTLAEAGLGGESQIRELVVTMNPERMKNHPVKVPQEYLITELLQK